MLEAVKVILYEGVSIAINGSALNLPFFIFTVTGITNAWHVTCVEAFDEAQSIL
jgi:hypothetical protein